MTVANAFDAGGNEADLAGAEFFDVLHFWGKNTDLINGINCVIGHHADLHFFADNAVMNPNQNDDAEIAVIPTVNQQGFQRRIYIADRRRQAGDDGFKEIVNAESGFSRCFDGFRCVYADNIFYLFLTRSGSAEGRSILFKTGTIS